MSEFESLLKRTHDAGLKALIDFVPNHVSRDYGKVGGGGNLGFSDDPSVHWKPENDFFYYPGQALTLPCPVPPGCNPYYENPAKASGNNYSPSPGINDWYETIRLNYCDFHTPTWDRMYGIVRYWCGKGVDGFRCDMVEMVPWQFMQWLITGIKAEFPEVIFVAEVYNKDLYAHYLDTVGFDLLYDKSGLYDTLRNVVEGKETARALTWNWQSQDGLQPGLLNFLENHDEQRFASDFFGKDAAFEGAALAASLLFNTSAFMIYFGEEIGERGMDAEGFSGSDGRTTIFDWWKVPSLARLHEYIHTGGGLTEEESQNLRLFRRSLALSCAPAVSEGGTYDLGYCNEGSPGFNPDRHFAFLRGGGRHNILIVCNFSGDDVNLTVRIPIEAVRYMGIRKTEAFEMNVSVKAGSYSVLPV